MQFSAKTDRGLVRRNNEDSFFARADSVGQLDNLFMVADGMGGHLGGEYASSFVVSEIPKLLEKKRFPAAVHNLLTQTTDQCNRMLYRKSREDDRLHGMGTTLVMLSIRDRTAHILNVGDSRLYLLRNGSLVQLTRDHSMVEELVSQGKLSRSDPFYEKNKNVITRAMGVSLKVEPDYFRQELQPGDRLLLCTDGLCGVVPEERLKEVLLQSETPETMTETLIEEARKAGGPDNITAILVDC